MSTTISGAERDPFALKLTGGTMTGQVVLSATGIKFSDNTTLTSAANIGSVTSVAGRTGAVVLSTTDISGMANYLTSSTAASTYQTISGMTSYLTTGSATSTYQPISGMSSYLTTLSASNTYQPISGMSSYLTSGSAASTYQPLSGMSSYALLASPTFTGAPKAPTAASTVNDTTIATTAYVKERIADLATSAPATLDTLNEIAIALGNDPNLSATLTAQIALKSPIDSPTFTGDPKAPTPATSDNDTSIATTAFVKNQGYLTSTSANLSNYAALTGAAFTGKVNINNGTTAVPLNIGSNVTPTTSVAGDMWIAQTQLFYKDSTGILRNTVSTGIGNTFTQNQTINQSSSATPSLTVAQTGNGGSVAITNSGSGTALKVTQTGSGESFRVEDETSPDATAFVIANDGKVGIGVAPTTAALTVDTSGIRFGDGTIQYSAGGAGGVTSVAGRTGAVSLTTADVAGLSTSYYPLLSNPSSYLVASDVTGLLNPYALDTDLNAYAPLAGATFTGQIVVPAAGIKFSDGSTIISAPSASSVTSVAGRTGAIVLSSSDLSDKSTLLSTSSTSPAPFIFSQANGAALNNTLGNSNSPWGQYVGIKSINFADTLFLNAAGNVGVGLRIQSTFVSGCADFSNIGTGQAPVLKLSNNSTQLRSTFSAPALQISNTSSASDQHCVLINNLGTGDCLRVEDSTSPDATPFVINNAGRVGIGVEPDATVALKVDSTGIKFNNTVFNPTGTQLIPVQPNYTKELLVTIDGVGYAIALRQI